MWIVEIIIDVCTNNLISLDNFPDGESFNYSQSNQLINCVVDGSQYLSFEGDGSRNWNDNDDICK